MLCSATSLSPLYNATAAIAVFGAVALGIKRRSTLSAQLFQTDTAELEIQLAVCRQYRSQEIAAPE